ncbi:hypothetical protein HMI56_004625, partial [Coelomomyces lativittatus]
PVLHYPNQKQVYHLFCDASRDRKGAALMQKIDQNKGTIYKNLVPIAFLLRTLGNAEKNYGITDVEGLAL